jgi:hypothetical protein
MLGHSSTTSTEQVYPSVVEDVEREAAESAAALVPPVPTVRPPTPMCSLRARLRAVWFQRRASNGETAGQDRWGGWGSNPRPRDYESHALTG